jgi:hypothetical protein
MFGNQSFCRGDIKNNSVQAGGASLLGSQLKESRITSISKQISPVIAVWRSFASFPTEFTVPVTVSVFGLNCYAQNPIVFPRI